MSPPPGSLVGPLWREMLISRAFLYISFKAHSKGALPGSPHRAPIEREALFPEPSFNYLSVPGEWIPPNNSLFPMRVPGKWAPVHVPQQGPYGERCCIYRANGLFIHLYPSESPVKEPSHEYRENIGHHPWSPLRMEGLHTMGCGLVPQGIVYDTAITTPVPCGLQHDAFCLGLGRPGAH